ncbi:hypothetical protein [Aquiflexum gelatinilyticum]|uniref:Uncharacterized protein n=1 Tax=Aquiflexum gelatinilyticum TaxID=2961943 RepID=A0A9X2P8E7_9BACT|nr:hypothetical protein [Aquiflexum gelatinilyticum]MCR9015104.1 hypothetical protein [Aquiflexum gelatinilyticum]
MYSINNLEFGLSDDSLIYGYDMMKAVVFKFDQKGNLINQNRFQEGGNEIDLLVIGDVYPVNQDSIFVVENGYGHLLLLDRDLKIKNSWNIMKLTGAKIGVGGSNTQVVNFEYIGQDPYITLVAFDRNFLKSGKEFFETSFLAVKINLSNGKFKPLFKYPKESPYREYLFWGDESPNILYFDKKYLVTFPMDPNIYIYQEDTEGYEVIPYEGKLNKTAIGVGFGMPQDEFNSNHYMQVFHNQNEFYLVSKSLLQKAGHSYFVRVARRALHEKNFDYKDLNTFLIQHPGHEFIIQIVDLNSNGKNEIREYKLPKEYKNFSYIDNDGKIYFRRTNEDSETYTVDMVSWNADDLE